MLVAPGPFDAVIAVDEGDHTGIPLGRLFGEVDQNSKTRLVFLDPRRWALLNGKDARPARTSRLFWASDRARCRSTTRPRASSLA